MSKETTYICDRCGATTKQSKEWKKVKWTVLPAAPRYYPDSGEADLCPSCWGGLALYLDGEDLAIKQPPPGAKDD